MKKALSFLLAAVCLLTAAVPAGAAEKAELTLASGGETDYRIIVSADAAPAELTAAETLADYLNRITGAVFPVRTDDEPFSEKELVVGVTDRDPILGIDRDAMDDDAVRVAAVGERLFFTGGTARGAVYSVYTFLEDHLGCRWFTLELTVTPHVEELTVPLPLDFFYEPPIRLRQSYWLFSTRDPAFCAAHKLHGVMSYLSEKYGGAHFEMAINSVHTLQNVIRPDMFAEHPEYFGADESGTRRPDRQPCLTDPEVLSLVTESALEYCRNYGAVYSVSQNDGMDFCKCERCAAFNAAHGGVDSAALIAFVNSVAKAVDEAFPGRMIETLAYQRSQEPPKGLAPAKNVVVRLCPISTCVLHDLDDLKCPSNAAFDRDMTGWAALTKNIYVWDYSTDFQYIFALFPNVNTLQARYRYFRDRNVISVFEHGCGEDIVPGELHELKTYLTLKLLWDPDTDVERHIREFCSAYYGGAADDVIDFINEFEDRIKGYNALSMRQSHVSCSEGGENFDARTSITERDVRALDKIMAKAESRRLTEDERHRLTGLKLSWRLFKNATFAGEFNWFSGKTDPEEQARTLFSDLKAYGVTHLGEAGSQAFGDRTPDLRVLPTYWFLTKSEQPPSVRFGAAVLPVINRISRAIYSFFSAFVPER